MTRLLSFGYTIVNIDLGEMFFNFPLHQSLKYFFGVDLTPFRGMLSEHYSEIREKYKGGRLCARWTLLCFGWNLSTDLSNNYYYLAEDFVRGKYLKVGNSLRCDEVVLHLMGNNDLDPALLNVYKWDKFQNK